MNDEQKRQFAALIVEAAIDAAEQTIQNGLAALVLASHSKNLHDSVCPRISGIQSLTQGIAAELCATSNPTRSGPPTEDGQHPDLKFNLSDLGIKE